MFCLSEILLENSTEQPGQINFFNTAAAAYFMSVHSMIIYSSAGFAFASQNNFYSTTVKAISSFG